MGIHTRFCSRSESDERRRGESRPADGTTLVYAPEAVAFARLLQKEDAAICSESTVEDLEQAMNGLAEGVGGPGCVWREDVVGEDLLPLRLQGALEGKRLRPG